MAKGSVLADMLLYSAENNHFGMVANTELIRQALDDEDTTQEQHDRIIQHLKDFVARNAK